MNKYQKDLSNKSQTTSLSLHGNICTVLSPFPFQYSGLYTCKNINMLYTEILNVIFLSKSVISPHYFWDESFLVIIWVVLSTACGTDNPKAVYSWFGPSYTHSLRFGLYLPPGHANKLRGRVTDHYVKHSLEEYEWHFTLHLEKRKCEISAKT